MSNKDWFQEAFNKHMETFIELLKLADEHNADIRLSACKDGTLVFSSNDGDVLKTLTQDEESITYTQHHEFEKNEEGV